MKEKLLISFSGGRTSAYMLWYMLFEWKKKHLYEIVVVFANTGKEAEGTLQFVKKCEEQWGVDIIWVEATHKKENGDAYSKRGWQVKHKIVTFETASRNGESFEEMCSLLGIPSTNAPFCSDQLKRKPIESYLKSIGWKPSSFYKAIGIRNDEIDRVNAKYKEKKILYVLVTDNPKASLEIMAWWSENNFDLDIHPDDGNCGNCWKKDLLRLCRNARRDENSYDWWRDVSLKHGSEAKRPGQLSLKPPYNFYRGNLSPDDIIAISKYPDNEINKIAKTWKLDGCSESCEAY